MDKTIPGCKYTEEEVDRRLMTVLLWRFTEELTLKECGQRLGVSPERIRQMEAQALRRCRGVELFKPATERDKRWSTFLNRALYGTAWFLWHGDRVVPS